MGKSMRRFRRTPEIVEVELGDGRWVEVSVEDFGESACRHDHPDASPVWALVDDSVQLGDFDEERIENQLKEMR